jgi:hypothetical protein
MNTDNFSLFTKESRALRVIRACSCIIGGYPRHHMAQSFLFLDPVPKPEVLEQAL